jgi:hypothetical protein
MADQDDCVEETRGNLMLLETAPTLTILHFKGPSNFVISTELVTLQMLYYGLSLKSKRRIRCKISVV